MIWWNKTPNFKIIGRYDTFLFSVVTYFYFCCDIFVHQNVLPMKFFEVLNSFILLFYPCFLKTRNLSMLGKVKAPGDFFKTRDDFNHLAGCWWFFVDQYAECECIFCCKLQNLFIYNSHYVGNLNLWFIHLVKQWIIILS